MQTLVVEKVATSKKEEFIKTVSHVITDMKQGSTASSSCKQKIICESETSDVAIELWDISIANQSGRRFKTHIYLTIYWKSGVIDNLKMPVEIWESKREFLEFLERECGK